MIVKGATLPFCGYEGSNYQQPVTLSGNASRIWGFIPPRTGTMTQLDYYVESASAFPITITGSVYTVGNNGLPNTLVSQKVLTIVGAGWWNFLSGSVNVNRGEKYYVKVDFGSTADYINISAASSDGFGKYVSYTHPTAVWAWSGTDLVSGSTSYKIHFRCLIDGSLYGFTNSTMTDTNGIWCGHAYRLPKPVKLVGVCLHEMSAADINVGPVYVRLFELPAYSWAPLNIDDYLEEIYSPTMVGQQRTGYETWYTTVFSRIYTLQNFAILFNNRVSGVKDTVVRAAARAESYDPRLREIRGQYERSCIFSWLGWRVFIGYSDGTRGYHIMQPLVVPYELPVNSVSQAIPFMVAM